MSAIISGLQVNRGTLRELSQLLLFVAIGIALRVLWPTSPDTGGAEHHLRMIVTMVWALMLVQALGVLLRDVLGNRYGSGISALLGGLVSSTAVVTAIAHRSRRDPSSDAHDEYRLIYACATLAMIVEAWVIVVIGAGAKLPGSIWLFGAPTVLAAWLAYRESRKIPSESPREVAREKLDWGTNVRLALMLVLLISLSRWAAAAIGKAGVFAITAIASIFETHATVISNVSLFMDGKITAPFFGGLVTLALVGSFFSKWLITRSLGSPAFAKSVLRWTLQYAAAAVGSWALYQTVLRYA